MIPLVNAIAEGWFRYMASAAFQATFLALLVVGVLRLGRRWPPALRHALLMLALLKFVIPPMLSLPTGVFNRVSQQKWSESASALRHVAPALRKAVLPLPEPVPQSRMTGAAQPYVQHGTVLALPAPAVQKPVLSAKGVLLLLHFSGALLILAAALLQQVYLRRLACRAGPVQDTALSDTYDALCRRLKPLTRPRLLISGNRHAPITFGAWKPVVMLPQAIIAALPLPEIRTILGHELAHHRRRDPWLAWLQVIISAVWWFNPVYWLLSRQIRSVREDCCDDLVVSSGIASRESYCRTLLHAARVTCRNPMAGAALAYVGESQPLHRRFKRIMTAKSVRVPKLARTAMLAIIALALLLLPGIKPRAWAEDSAIAEPYASNTNHVRPEITSLLQKANQNSKAQKAGHKNKAEVTSAQILSSASQQPQSYDRRSVPEYYLQQSEGPISKYYFKWLTEDVFYIITPEERRVFLALGTDQERDSFIEQFWARRDSSFKEEHYRRIAYANEHFTSSVPGWRTDRGRIYIMFGKPDETESHPAGGSYQNGNTYPFEIWWYRHINGVGDDVEIQFVDFSRTGEYRMAMSPEEKFVEKPDSSGSFYYQVKIENLGTLAQAALNPAASSLDPFSVAVIKTKLEAKQAELARLRSVYSANHPDVLRLAKEVTELEQQAASASRAYEQSREKTLWRFTFQIDNKGLQFVKQQDVNRAIVKIYGKISNTNGRVFTEWEEVIAAEYTDQLLEAGKAKQTERQRIVLLPPGLQFKTDLIVTDVNSKKTGIREIDPFERMEQYFDNAEKR